MVRKLLLLVNFTARHKISLTSSSRWFTASLCMHEKEKAHGGGGWGMQAKQARKIFILFPTPYPVKSPAKIGCCDSIASRHQTTAIKLCADRLQSWHAMVNNWWNIIFWFSAKQATIWLSRFSLDVVASICAERWSQIHGIQPLNMLTVSNVHRT